MNVLSKRHPQEDLIRYVDGDLSSQEKENVERHLNDCAECREELNFVRSFHSTLRQCDDSAFPKGPCIPSELLVSHVAGEVDEETARRIRLHLLACNDCAGDYYALRRAKPKVWDIGLRVANQLIERWQRPAKHDDPEYVSQLAFAKVRGVPTLSSPFETTETQVDPETGSVHEITLRVEAGLEPDRVQVILESEPVPEKWVVTLYDAEEEPDIIQISKSSTIINNDLAFGFYKVAVQKRAKEEDETLAEFRFTVEPFSRSEAINTALEYLREHEYVRALAILEDAAKRYKNDAEIWDMLCVAQAIVYEDRPAYEEELKRSDPARVRGARDFLKDALAVLKRVPDTFRGRPAAKLAEAVLNRSQALPSIPQEASVALLSAIQILSERVTSLEQQTKPLAGLLSTLNARLDEIPTLLATLEVSINAVRADTAIDVDEKFRKIGESLDRLTADLEKKGITPPDYGVDLRAKLGDACWLWLENHVQRMFVWAETLHWHLAGMPAGADPDFSPALFELCRGFELLLNVAVGRSCTTIKDHLKKDPAAIDAVHMQFPNLRLSQFLQYEGTLSIPQTAHLLRSGFALRSSMPGALLKDVEYFLDRVSGLADPGFLEALALVGTYFRNGKIHAKPGSPWNFTSMEEMLLLRKLILGLDEQRVDGTKIFQRIRGEEWLPKERAQQAANTLSQSWTTYQGMTKILSTSITKPGST